MVPVPLVPGITGTFAKKSTHRERDMGSFTRRAVGCAGFGTDQDEGTCASLRIQSFAYKNEHLVFEHS